MDKTYYIYGLTEPNTGIIKYIGFTKSPSERYKGHLAHGRFHYIQTNKARWIKDLLDNGENPGFVILDVCENIKEAREREREYVGKYVSNGLVNSISHLYGKEDFPAPLRQCEYIHEHNNKRCRRKEILNDGRCWQHADKTKFPP